MADDNSIEADVAQAAEEVHKEGDKGATARKKSLGGLDSTSVLSGPRQRKKAEHYKVEVKEKPEFVIKTGMGMKLGDIPNVHYLLGKLKTDDELLTSLHNLLFKRSGTAHRRKKNLYEFSGLTFDGDEKEKELEKLQERLGKWTIALLNGALDVFELPRGNGDEGKKEAKIERLLKFLEEPKKVSEKDLAAQAAKKKDAAKAKKEEQKSKTPKSAAKGGRKSEGAQEPTKKKRAKKAESDEEPAEEPSEEEEVEEEEEQPKKRAKKEEVGSPKKAVGKTPTSRKATNKKRKADEEDVAEPVSAEGVDEANSSVELPDDDAIKAAVLELLEVSDVNQVTVKDLLKQLKEKFGKDLSKKRALIKDIAVDYAKTMAAASQEAGEEDAGEDAEEVSAKKQKGEASEASESAAAMNAEQAAGVTEEEKAEPEAETKEAAAEGGAKGEDSQQAAKVDAAAPVADASANGGDVADSTAEEADNGKAAEAGDTESKD